MANGKIMSYLGMNVAAVKGLNFEPVLDTVGKPEQLRQDLSRKKTVDLHKSSST